MDGTRFDALTRQLALRLSRRSFLRLTAVGAASATLPLVTGRTGAAAQSDASALVRQFYELVNAYQYEQAYALLGSTWHKEQSLQDFTGGYGNTAFVQCRTTGETASGASTVVGVDLISWHNDGTIAAYTGGYTVGIENGKPVILAGNNRTTAVPRGTPPLCAIADLAFGFGAWNGAAGSRIGSIVAKNRGDRVCVVGGSPRVTLRDTTGSVLISTSEAGSRPVAIRLDPGGRAQAPLSFSNWCGSTGRPASVRVEVPGDLEAVDRVSFRANGISFPPCNGPGQPATMAIKGWVRR